MKGILCDCLLLCLLIAPWCCNVNAATTPGYRLPDMVIPQHYIVDVITNLEENDFSFYGKVWIKILVQKSTDTIILHSRNLSISESKVSLKQIISEESLQVLPIASIRLVPANEFLIIKSDQELMADKEYILYIPFAGELTESLAGYYRSSYFDRAANKTKWLAVTQFESTDARRAFPCFDEPAMKARFTINLGHKKHLKSISNMPLVNTTDIEGMEGWVWDKYEDTVPMSTYLVAFMVSEFEYKVADKTDNNVTFRIWARKDALDQVEFARKSGPKFLEYYEKYFDVKYPLPKQDMVAIPDFSAGAMENWGLITYRETALLFDEKTSSAASKQSIASIIAHELAHQWFGNLVTMKWWTDLWLNEGFATYVAGLGVHHVFPEWNSLNSVAVDNMLVVFSLDSLKSSHPVSVTIGNPNEIAQIFDTISYKKGSYLLRMMNLFLGEDVFRSGVTTYLIAHKYSNAEQNDLWASLTGAAHKSGTLDQHMTVKEIMDTWTLQTGYPVVTVTRDYGKGSAKIEQSRYLAVKLSAREEEKSCWWIPISYTTQKEVDFTETKPKLWLSCKENGEINDIGEKEDWIILNINAAGLFRVNYDDTNWNNLAATLNSENYTTIGTLNRVQLLADSLEFAWSGDLDYQLAFQILKYLKLEKEYLPWKSGLNNLNNIEKLLRRTSVYGMFKKYVRSLLSPMYKKFHKITDTPHNYEEVKFKSLITSWACRMEVDDCVEQALTLFKQWKNEKNPDTTNPIPADMRGLVYCLGIKHGGEKDWDYLWERYNKSNVGTEQSLILSALGCSRDVWILNRYLEMSINEHSNIRRQDSVSVFASVARNEVGYYLAKTFLYKNIKRIYDYFGPKTSKIGRYVSSLSDHMISDEELHELKGFLDENKDYIKYSALAAKQSMESTLVNIRWFSNYYSKVLRLVAQ
ncbi:aminopeptidase N-like [Lycorma delicatula]|uniref:aminopeptidase N-like n=1 Tax=Lycorma delicatula TaxID=130591 RepID=UPI003F51A29E